MSKTLKTISASDNIAGLNRTIERAKQELENMIDLNPQIMLLVDRNGTVVRANKALLNLLSFSSFNLVLGKTLDELFSCEGMLGRILPDKTQQSVVMHEATVTLPTSARRHLKFHIVKSDKKAATFVVVIFDITSDKEHAAHLEKKHKKEAVEALMGALMHNINQPLTVIMVRAQLMHMALQKSEINAKELSKNLEDIMRLSAQIADLLRAVEKPKDYVTTNYVRDVEILDIQRSGSRPEGLEESCTAVLDALITAMNAHEPGSMAHAKRVGEYAAAIAKEMGLNAAEIAIVRRCALVHDIGKIGIPDKILQKPESLTEEEKEIMMSHAEIGYNLLRDFPFLTREAEATRANHERFDGHGYPRQLRGEEIPLEARIVAVADSYDAMRSGRVYRAAIPAANALAEIVACSGTQFDPSVVKAFKKIQSKTDVLLKNQT
ncbi:MAG: HD domain-containing protein [Lentisphaerae bacterium]|nr:HD domain-containing protein [Lentisphaerota bacterium]